MLLRPGASRALLRGLPKTPARPLPSANKLALRGQFASTHCTWASRPVASALRARTYSTLPPTDPFIKPSTTHSEYDKIDRKAEAEIAKQKLPTTPETVSTTSTVHPVFGEVGKEEPPPDTDMMASMRSDIQTVKETFSLAEVPKDAMYLGLAGVLPYLATSLGTVYSAYEMDHAAKHGIGFLLHEDQAAALLHFLEPLQVGYGAVIITFLGAVHWGMEWAGYNGRHGRQRYAIGVLAPAVAWPTLFFPAQEALICQFLAFTFLYNADANAGRRGLAPPWYGKYRFVLTFIVGASIVLTLIGRSHAGAQADQVPGAIKRAQSFREFAATDEEKRKLEDEEEAEEEAKLEKKSKSSNK